MGMKQYLANILLAAGMAGADTVVLQNGNEFEGSIKLNKTGVELQYETGKQTISFDQVAHIEKGNKCWIFNDDVNYIASKAVNRVRGFVLTNDPLEQLPDVNGAVLVCIPATYNPAIVKAVHQFDGEPRFQLCFGLGPKDYEDLPLRKDIIQQEVDHHRGIGDASEYCDKRQFKPGDKAPDFSGALLDGTQVSLDSYKGKILVLDFTASWCGWCTDSIPEMNAAYDRFKNDTNFLGISLDENKDELAGWVTKNDIQYQMLFGRRGFFDSIADRYNIKGIPAICIVKDGKFLAYDINPTNLSSTLEGVVAKEK